jgi:hypothetical protein
MDDGSETINFFTAFAPERDTGGVRDMVRISDDGNVWSPRKRVSSCKRRRVMPLGLLCESERGKKLRVEGQGGG